MADEKPESVKLDEKLVAEADRLIPKTRAAIRRAAKTIAENDKALAERERRQRKRRG